MNELWRQALDTVQQEFSDLPDVGQFTRVVLRLALALVLGAVIGWERERGGHEAGLRTHMLVAVGTAVFVLVPQQAGMSLEDLSRVLQGILAGIGFLGAGAVLKLGHLQQIRGLTTAAGIWATAAIGVTVGMGREATAVLTTLIVFVVLSMLPIERRIANRQEQPNEESKGSADGNGNDEG